MDVSSLIARKSNLLSSAFGALRASPWEIMSTPRRAKERRKIPRLFKQTTSECEQTL
jgi:hypothetical protein